MHRTKTRTRKLTIGDPTMTCGIYTKQKIVRWERRESKKHPNPNTKWKVERDKEKNSSALATILTNITEEEYQERQPEGSQF